MLLLGEGTYALASISVRDARGDELLPRSVLQLGPDDAFPWLSTSPSGWTAPPSPPHPIFGSWRTDALPSGARRRLAAATSVTSPGLTRTTLTQPRFTPTLAGQTRIQQTRKDTPQTLRT